MQKDTFLKFWFVLQPLLTALVMSIALSLTILIVSLSLLRTFHEARPVEPITHRQLVTELPFVKPLTDVIAGRESRQ